MDLGTGIPLLQSPSSEGREKGMLQVLITEMTPPSQILQILAQLQCTFATGAAIE